MKRLLLSCMLTAVLAASSLAGSPASAANGDGYCGHGYLNTLFRHVFNQHHYWSPTYDGHKHYVAGYYVGYNYGYCGH